MVTYKESIWLRISSEGRQYMDTKIICLDGELYSNRCFIHRSSEFNLDLGSSDNNYEECVIIMSEFTCQEVNKMYAFVKYIPHDNNINNNVHENTQSNCSNVDFTKSYMDQKRFCELCGKMFSNIKAFYNHRFQVHSKTSKDFLCPQCSKTFAHKYLLMQHVSRVHCEANYKCDHCTKCYKTLFTLHRHIKQMHPI